METTFDDVFVRSSATEKIQPSQKKEEPQDGLQNLKDPKLKEAFRYLLTVFQGCSGTSTFLFEIENPKETICINLQSPKAITVSTIKPNVKKKKFVSTFDFLLAHRMICWSFNQIGC